MKRFLVFLLIVPLFSVAQQTYVPDDNFEAYLETHDWNDNLVPLGDPLSMGNGIANDDYVTTSNIDTITWLNAALEGIWDLTGIEDFANLEQLHCQNNALTSLDVSNNTTLTSLWCDFNQLTSLDVSGCTALTGLSCHVNYLTSLDVSGCTALTGLACYNNWLTCLNTKNGNWSNMYVSASNNNLTCVEVDDIFHATLNWNFGLSVTFSTDCNYPASCWATSIQEYSSNINLFPNPTGDLITLDINGYNGSIQTQVYDLSGRLLKSSNNTTISLKDYAKGIYVFRVAYGDRVEELKVVKY